MPEDTQAVKTPEKETQESPMPSEEQKTTESTSVEQSSVAPEGEQKVAPPEETQEVGEGLPKDSSERTKHEFEKLRTQLREERIRREKAEGFYRTNFPPKEQEVTLPPIVDPNTGLLNEQAVQERDRLLYEAQQRAQRAEQTALNLAQQVEEKETFTSYPELNPNDSKYDREFHVQVRRALRDSMLYPEDYGSRELSFKEAADLVKKTTPKVVEAAKAEGAQEALEKLSPKEQAALEAVGSPARRTQVSNIDDLRKRTRKGDIEAIVERLQNVKR